MLVSMQVPNLVVAREDSVSVDVCVVLITGPFTFAVSVNLMIIGSREAGWWPRLYYTLLQWYPNYRRL